MLFSIFTTAVVLVFTTFIVVSRVLVFWINFVAVYSLVAMLTAEMTDYNWRFLLILEILIRRCRQFKSGMHVFTVGTFGTESSQVIGAQHPPDVPVSTVRTVSAEATVVPRTVLDLTFGVYVKERTLFVVAGVEPRVKVTFWHFCHVVFVQEFTLVSFLA